MFEPVAPGVSFPDIETEILDFWASERIFAKCLENREGGPRFTFYEGPPTANNKPGLHHVWARVFKDVFCRYKTMRGYQVPRKAGWDCHGLPVEVEVEKALGISSKRGIEELGVEEFNRRCRDSIKRYVEDWEKLTRRIGFWLDTENAYWTLADDYVESVWWQLGRMWDSGLLYEDLKVVPYCPRCGTALSSAEVAQGYKDTVDKSAIVRFPLVDEPEVSLLVWTTTPWTLISNVGVAAHPRAIYVRVKVEGEVLILAKDLIESLFGDVDVEIISEFPGSELSAKYLRPFDYLVEEAEPAYTVVHADFVTMDEGTGLVHLAPAFGEIDRVVGREYGLGQPNPVDAEGRFTDAVPPHAGTGVRDANESLIDELRGSGRLYRAEDYEHSYPHCWRCATPLIYWSKSSWYVKTTSVKDRMILENAEVGWHPSHIKDGRFGDWLANNIDWSLSRDRYWGTPLPIWKCPEGHATFVRSRAELGELAGEDLADLDPHRPYIDRVTFPCPECDPDSVQRATRVSPVIDAWFDSGAMPAAQWGYPNVDGSKAQFESAFPADFICEAIDQTRGWFYSLLAVATLAFDAAPYRNVLCLGHIVDADGKKMSKSIGNIIDPWTILDNQGADPLRWFFLSSGSPWTSSRISIDAIDRSTSQFLLTLWNTYSFFVTYANADEWNEKPASDRDETSLPLIDKWILSRLTECTAVATDAMDRYDALSATRALADFVSDLSNWFVRRSRRRFWSARDGDVPAEEKESAYRTLRHSLITVARLLAPFCPFVSEAIWQNLTGDRQGRSASVHLEDWPVVDHSLRRPEIEDAVDSARRIVGLGRSARTESKIRTRQPLARALVVLPDANTAKPSGELEATITEELNVDAIEYVDSLSHLVDVEVKPNFKVLGPRLGKDVQTLSSALAQLDTAPLAAELERGCHVAIRVGGQMLDFTPDELEVRRAQREGFAVMSEAGFGVALDLEVTDELRDRGIAREVTHSLQGLRKTSGLEISDRIRLWVSAPAGSAVDAAIKMHAPSIERELLALSLTEGEPPTGTDPDGRAEISVLGETIIASIKRA